MKDIRHVSNTDLSTASITPEQRIHDGRAMAGVLERGLGRRNFLKAAMATSALGVGATVASCSGDHVGATPAAGGGSGNGAPGFGGTVLQPDAGDIPGKHYVKSTPDSILWGYVPSVHDEPVLRMKSGETVTMDLVSHEGIMEDQGRDPVSYFGGKGIDEKGVLQDAIDIAAEYSRTERDFKVDGPHVVTGPVFVEGAMPGDVLKIEPIANDLRVPYGVVSSRHGKGALASTPELGAPDGIVADEVMPPLDVVKPEAADPMDLGNVSVFTPVEDGHGVMASGPVTARFPLRPFAGMMGVAFSDGATPTDPRLNSVPPTLGGGNIDIHHLGTGSAFYLPVRAEGALFYAGDPHMAMGDGEVALTAMEGSLRSTFRLTVCKRGSGDAPSVAFDYPWAETEEHWIPIGLSDPDGLAGGGVSGDLNVAMRRAVVNALNFLEHDLGMDRAIAYAYLSAAADFALSQVVDRTVGVHGLIRKADFG